MTQIQTQTQVRMVRCALTAWRNQIRREWDIDVDKTRGAQVGGVFGGRDLLV